MLSNMSKTLQVKHEQSTVNLIVLYLIHALTVVSSGANG